MNNTLLVIPSVPMWSANGYLKFDRKFYDGMLSYLAAWEGQLVCLIRISHSAEPDFGLVQQKESDLPFGLVTLGADELITKEHLVTANVVLASGDDFSQLHVAALCQDLGSKCVYIIENIPETRYQIASLSTNNAVIKLRRYLYLWLNEFKRLKSFKQSHAIQSNGTAAYYHYKNIPNNLLYFDTRVSKKDIISDAELQNRLAYLVDNQPLRLAFSGRLIAIKGADHLVKLALALKQRKTNFIFNIYGSGDLAEYMHHFILEHQLEKCVFMKGVVDFNKELLPALKSNIDLFVMLHRQGDPSCTYLETLSCGIPIVGYQNKAFEGILDLADVGWLASMDDVEQIANIIEKLSLNRKEIEKKSIAAVQFSKLHDFETTFENRVKQLAELGTK